MVLVLIPLALAACKDHEFHPPDREEQVMRATTRYRHADFDTIAWADSVERMMTGNQVFAAHCRKCHGTVGEGGTEYAATQGFDVPSLVRADWPYDSIGAVRERVFAGHAEGMPSWGLGRLTLREIDAAAHYVQYGLRTETPSIPEP